MGGGDLNLKKSWHPHTLKNQEIVWKAEQAKNQEERKLNDLRKEIEEERTREELKRHGEASGILLKSDGDKKLEWMYKNTNELINREEYLLGRTIDKSFEKLHAEEQRKEQNLAGVKQSINHVEHECIPFSIRAYRNMESTEQVDLQRKVLEDPLMLIKQKEMESRKQLLENPVKLKELHRILKKDQLLQSKVKKSKKSKKSKKKHKKRSRSSSSDTSSSDSENDLDKELEKRYKNLKNCFNDDDDNVCGLDLTKLLEAKYDTISKELDKAVATKQKEISGRHSNNVHNDPKRHSMDNRQYRERSRRDHRYRSPQRRRDVVRLGSRSRTPTRHRHEERGHTTTRQPQPRTGSPFKRRDFKPKETNKSSKLTEEEKEARRREMMENAAWRETDRSQAVQKHRDAYTREEESNQKRGFDKNFINKEVKKAMATHTSVGSRIRSNLNNIQRTSSAMSSSFVRK